ncbi:MAG: S1 RNA-binding domain-containing protein [Chloroflexota bacterium]|nr:S1 RNA-binding domain-containing protein [Chloroflexota bacterium]
MSLVPPWEVELDEDYWNAIVTQGRWVSSVSPQPEEISGLPAIIDKRFSPREIDQKWERLDELFNDGTVLCLEVTGYNKGGLLVDWESLQGFVPISQLLDAPVQADECARMDYLASHVGQELKVKVIELDRTQNRIIFSHRAARWGECCPDSLLANLRSGDICEGDVSNLCDFGVFVDLGGIDGLIHVSELSWRRVNHPRDVLQVGQRIKVFVIDVDHKRRRIALSLKRLQPNPWATVAERYRPGMVVEAVVTNVVEFGAFARIEDGVEGLIHVSELVTDDDPYDHPHDVVQEGDRLQVRILSVDPDNQRMGLSLRGVQADDDAD